MRDAVGNKVEKGDLIWVIHWNTWAKVLSVSENDPPRLVVSAEIEVGLFVNNILKLVDPTSPEGAFGKEGSK